MEPSPLAEEDDDSSEPSRNAEEDSDASEPPLLAGEGILLYIFRCTFGMRDVYVMSLQLQHSRRQPAK